MQCRRIQSGCERKGWGGGERESARKRERVSEREKHAFAVWVAIAQVLAF